MSTKKQKLIDLISALETERSIDYFYNFVTLSLYGTADCPISKFEEVCGMYEKQKRRKRR